MLSEPWRRSQGGGTSTAEEHDSVNPGGGLRVVVLVHLRNMILPVNIFFNHSWEDFCTAG